jgi:hypothetical protein
VSRPESTANRPERTTEAETGSTFLGGIEFLTGRDPNLGSFLLVVGIVTCVFVALFQFTLPTPISHLLTAGVLFVTALSAVFAALLDGLGHFDRSAVPSDEDGARKTTARPWVPVGKASAPLPPLINFDAELRAYAAMYDGDLPGAFDPFIHDYLRLKTNTRNRATIASDLRADLNPIGALFADGTEGNGIYEDMSRRLFRYIGDRTGLLAIDRIAFYDEDGTETDVGDIRGRLGRVELDVTNEGESATVEATITLHGGGGAAIASRTCAVGTVGPGATKTVETDVFVPADAERASATVRPLDPGGDRRERPTPPKSGVV